MMGGIQTHSGIKIRKSMLLILMLLLLSGFLELNDTVSTAKLVSEGLQQKVYRCCPPTPLHDAENHPTSLYLFGVLNDSGNHYDDEWARGVRATNLELHWDKYETSEGVYDSQYINHMRQIMVNLKSQGWYIQLVPGDQYVPQWVFTTYPGFYFVNQFGEIYNPDPTAMNDLQAINAPFNSQARALIANYLQHLLTVSFPQDDPMYKFDSIRVGGGPQGELRYPGGDWNGHTNSYWAFDTAAQNPAISGIPLEAVGWRPGVDPNPGSLGHGQLIVNEGFEISHEYYPIFGWSPDDEVTASFDRTAPHTGTNAMKITIQSPHRVHQFVKVDPNTEYKVADWMRSYDGIGMARLFLTQYDVNSNLIAGSPFVKLEVKSINWEYAEANLTTSSSTRFIKVELDGDRAGDFYFDDLQLKRVGEPDNRSREIDIPTSFYDWYVNTLTDFQNWQVNEIRKYFDGQLDVLYPGKGIQSKQIMGALTNDLSGNGWSEGLSSLYAGTDFQRHVNGLNSKDNIALYVTGIDVESQDQVDDDSLHPGDWSAARWIAYLAYSNGMLVWGENSGRNSAEKMWLSAKRMYENNFIGMMWGFEAELYANPNPNGFATMADYEQVIYFYHNFKLMYIPIILHK